MHWCNIHLVLNVELKTVGLVCICHTRGKDAIANIYTKLYREWARFVVR